MRTRLFAIVNNEGEMLVYEGPLSGAIEEATARAEARGGVVDLTGVAGDPPDGDFFTEPEEDPDRISLAANVVDPARFVRESPGKAARGLKIRLPRTGLAPDGSEVPQASMSDVMALSLQEAHARVRHLFPDKKVYDDPETLATALFGQNAKTEKPGQIDHTRARLSHFDDIDAIPAFEIMALSFLPQRLAYIAMGEQEGIPVRGTFCARSVTACQNTCLVHSGRNPMDPYNVVVKYARSRAFIEQPLSFLRLMTESIFWYACQIPCHRRQPMFRLNTYSDIPWELVFPDLFEEHAEVQFYDYTKVPGRQPPRNYDLTFSYSGSEGNKVATEHEISRGSRVAVVFMTRQGDLPETFLGLPVIDGSIHDARPYDPGAVIVGLEYRYPSQASRKASKRQPAGLPPHLVAITPKPPRPDEVRSRRIYREFVLPVEKVDGRIIAAETPRFANASALVDDED